MASGVDDAIARELELLAPAESADGADWREVRRRAGLPAGAAGPPGRRALLALLVLLLAAGAAVPALALSGDLRELLGLSDRPPPEPVFERARLLVEAPADRGEVARLYEAPASTGGTCWFVELAPLGSPRRATASDGGGVCRFGDAAPRIGVPISWSLAMQPRTRNNVRGWRAPILHGRVDPRLRAIRVVLEWSGGAHRLPFANDHFLFVSSALYAPPERRLPYEIAAYDAAGQEVARARIHRSALYVR